MIAGKFYPQKANITKKIKGYFPIVALSLCSLLLLSTRATSQTYYSVSNLSGTTSIGGDNVTVTSSGVASSFPCSGVSQPYLEGQDVATSTFGVGSYTWSFSVPAIAVRIHIESINVGDDVTISINGVPYTLTASNISPLVTTSTCTSSSGTAVASGGNLVNSGGGGNSATIDIAPGFGINSVTVQSLGGDDGVINDFNFVPNSIPVFVNGTNQQFAVCQSSTANDISAMLAVADSNLGQLLTWTLTTAPTHGLAGGFPESITATTDTTTPALLNYTPMIGYSGFDTMAVQLTDGINTTTATLIITVNPNPTLSSSNIIPSICSQSLLSYNPTSPIAGTAFAWTRAVVSGISNAAGSGTGNPNEVLDNISYYPISVTYFYTLTASGCSDTASVMVTVKPTPILSSSLTDTICNGQVFHYIPTSATSGTTFAWTRASVAGISPATGSGVDTVNESLSNTTSAPLNTVYVFALDADGCTSFRNVTVTVNPALAGSPITTMSPSTLCAGTMYQNFGTSVAPTTGVSYTWSTVNATINAIGNNGQFAIISFNNPGNAVVTLTSTIPGSVCLSTSTYDVTVGNGENPTAVILYYNGQFIYQDNTADSYQWGYDDVTSLAPTEIAGADFQSYPTTTPDFTDNYYWVMTTKNGCTQKTYYNAPLAVHNIRQGSASLKLSPNPASNNLTIEINVPQGNATTVSVIDMLGQTVKTVSVTGHTTQLDIAGMPAGCYLVSCNQNGVKIATGRFIKN